MELAKLLERRSHRPRDGKRGRWKEVVGDLIGAGLARGGGVEIPSLGIQGLLLAPQDCAVLFLD